jgi:hypothetical protein
MSETILDRTGHDACDPDRHWVNGFMGMLKSVGSSPIMKWSDFMWGVEYALRTEQRTHTCPTAYLEELR